jgi:hypothetical protein
MTHLTNDQILQFVDGTADYMMQATCTNHLATCEKCRREVELQKVIVKTARETGLMMPSRSFTRAVMSTIVPGRVRRMTRWALDNMGGMFAMMAVLGVTGAVLFGERGEESITIELPAFDMERGTNFLEGVWSGASEMLSHALSVVSIPPISGEGNVVLIFTSVAALVLLDRLVRNRLLASVE